MIPLIRQEVVEKKNWMPMEEFIDMLSIAQSSPGPLAVNTSVFVGYRLGGIRGVFVSTLGSILPSFVIILTLAKTYVNFERNIILQNSMRAIRPVVVALILSSAYSIADSMKIGKKGFLIPLAVLMAVSYFKLSPIVVIFIGALGGVLYFSWKEGKQDA